MADMYKQKLITEIRDRSARLLSLLDKIEAGEEIDPMDGLYCSGDVEVAARLLRKHFGKQH